MVYSEIVVLSISFINQKNQCMHWILKKKILTWAGVGREFLFQSCAIIKKKKSANNYKIKEKIKEKFINLFSDN